MLKELSSLYNYVRTIWIADRKQQKSFRFELCVKFQSDPHKTSDPKVYATVQRGVLRITAYFGRFRSAIPYRRCSEESPVKYHSYNSEVAAYSNSNPNSGPSE